MTNEDCLLPGWLVVSRETQKKLISLLELVERWNPAINLVSSSSLEHGWTRHILDSAQLSLFADIEEGLWLDIGSGAGFPGLVVALVAQERWPRVRVTLVESDRRKATFLSEAIRNLNLASKVVCGRVEQIDEMGATVVSARAFAPLDKLLGDVKRHLRQDGVGLLLKGQQYQAEMLEADRHWTLECDILPSKTDDRSVVLKVQKIKHV
jgi:16S rRNA (guanine527-N7)-methyltransferase